MNAVFCLWQERRNRMAPQTTSKDQERTEEARLQEQFAGTIEDRSRPAQEVLTDQQNGRNAENAPVLYVP
jgi:hypothetical protein